MKKNGILFIGIVFVSLIVFNLIYNNSRTKNNTQGNSQEDFGGPKEEIERAMENHILESAELIGLYARSFDLRLEKRLLAGKEGDDNAI